MIRRRVTLAAAAFLIIGVGALSGCAGQDVQASTHPKNTRPTQVGATTWYLPTTVTLTPVPSPTSSAAGSGTGAGTGAGIGTGAAAGDPTAWTVQGTGTWAGRAVQVFARPTTGIRSSSLLIGQLLGVAQVGGIPTFSSLGGHKVSVSGADLSEVLTFSYSGTDGTGQGLWLAAVQSKSSLGVVLQVATRDKTVDPAFVQQVVDSLQFTKR